MSAFTTLTQHNTGSPSHSNQTRRRNKKHPNWKGGSKNVIFTDNMILYMENPIDSNKNTTRHNKQIWQSSRIQNQYSEVDAILIHK